MKHGMLIDVAVKSTVAYCRAKFPPQEVPDFMAMCIEASFECFNTPEDLYKAAVESKPLSKTVFTKSVTHDGVYNINDLEALNDLP